MRFVLLLEPERGRFLGDVSSNQVVRTLNKGAPLENIGVQLKESTIFYLQDQQLYVTWASVCTIDRVILS